MQYHAFTCDYNKKVRQLITEVSLIKPQERAKNIKQYNALWDTGATSSSITQEVVDNLKLEPIDKVIVNHAGGNDECYVYLVNIILPNNVGISSVRVSCVSLTSDPNLPINVLIGMNLISLGDFAVTNYKEKTTMSFVLPSHNRIDFVPDANKLNIQQYGNRE